MTMTRSSLFRGQGAAQRGTCRRCRGFMVPSFTDTLLMEIAEAPQTFAWRCVNCGEWIDVTIVTNRKRAASVPPLLPLVSRRRWR